MKGSSQNAQPEWSLEIDAGKSSVGFGFKDWKQYRNLISLLVRRDFVSIYKQTILGPLWLFLQPILKVAIFYFIFARVIGIPTDGIPPILFYLTGLTFWEFFSNNVKKVSGSLILNQQLLSKVYFNRMVIPISIMFSNGIRLGVQMVLLMGAWGYYYFTGLVALQLTVLMLPIFVVVICLLGVGVGMLLASFSTVFRDLRFIIDTALQILFYLTPVIYPLSLVPGISKSILWLNPMVALLEGIKYMVLGVGELSLIYLVSAAVVSVLVFLIGARRYLKASQNFVDRV